MDRKFYVIGARAGKSPVLKRPVTQSFDCVLQLAKELVALYPDDRFCVLEVMPNGELFVQSVGEIISIYDKKPTCRRNRKKSAH